jgi:hypothetical protein
MPMPGPGYAEVKMWSLRFSVTVALHVLFGAKVADAPTCSRAAAFLRRSRVSGF